MASIRSGCVNHAGARILTMSEVEATEPVAAGSAPTKAAPLIAVGSPEDFAEVLKTVQDAAREWGVRQDLMEGKFVSALLGAVAWLGRVNQAAQAEFRQIAQKQSDAAKLELARAEALTKATNATLGQARSALINLQVERENVTVRMIHETMPMFAEELRKALVIRVNDETSALKLKRGLVAACIAVGVFLGGYGLRAWSDRDAVGALERCLSKPLQSQVAGQTHLYCDVTAFATPGG
jgi:hypothetical protein